MDEGAGLGLRFRSVDRIAQSSGMGAAHVHRTTAAICDVLTHHRAAGHTGVLCRIDIYLYIRDLIMMIEREKMVVEENYRLHIMKSSLQMQHTTGCGRDEVMAGAGALLGFPATAAHIDQSTHPTCRMTSPLSGR